MSKYPEEMNSWVCELSGTTCDKDCPYLNQCPYEIFDVKVSDAQKEFVKGVTKLIKKDEEKE